MEAKHCTHLQTDVEIDRNFLKNKKDGLKALKCLGNFFNVVVVASTRGHEYDRESRKLNDTRDFFIT